MPASGFTPAFAAAVRSSVWELTAVAHPRISIWLDGSRLPLKNIGHFASLFALGAAKPLRSVETSADGRVLWDVSLIPVSGDMPADVIGFVNGVRCSKGKHVSHLLARVAAMVEDAVRRKTKQSDLDVTAAHTKASFFAVLSVAIDGPRFKSQNKDCLDTPVSDWGFSWKPDEAFTKRLAGLLADSISARVTYKADAEAVKEATKSTGGKRSVNIPKYDPAEDAGKANTQAILILTEGDSAKTLALAGRAVTGSSLIGIFCLKGKPVNPRGKDLRKYAGNEVLGNVARILGLEYGKVFHTEADLRCLNYKSLVLLADQDYDGGHIVGLVCNWIEYCWPTLLLLRPDFIRRFATPIVIATCKKSYKALAAVEPQRKFLSQPEFKRWLLEDSVRQRAYDFSYFKGLGGHSSKQGREYFSAYADYSVTLLYEPSRDKSCMEDFFDKKRADVRKHLIANVYSEDRVVDYSQDSVTMTEFLMAEPLAYFNDDVKRSISGVDGLKRTQRKLLWASRQILAPGKVSKLTDLAMECGKRSKYHHGETSLYTTLVGMAQAHPGTNNINMFLCEAQMGDRHNPCNEFTAPRYLSTGPEQLLPALFRQEDDCILVHLVEDGKEIVEPQCFFPVIPVDILNGCVGIGTGWNTMIPAYHPSDVARAFRLSIAGEEGWQGQVNSLMPWFDGLTGPILSKPTSWQSVALYTVTRPAPQVVHVVLYDLPYCTWTNVYYEKTLKPLLTGPSGGFISRIESDNTDTRLRYTLVCDSAAMSKVLGSDWDSDVSETFVPDARGHVNTADVAVLAQAAAAYATNPRRFPKLEKTLDLTAAIYKTWMYRLNSSGRIHHFDHLSDLVQDYTSIRLDAYSRRLDFQAKELARQKIETENRLRFVREITGRTMNGLDYDTVAEWWTDLGARGYVSDQDPRVRKPAPLVHFDLPVDVVDAHPAEPDAVASYHYLTDMRMSSCTQTAVARISAELDKIVCQQAALATATPKATWLTELDEFEEAYRQFVARRVAANHVDIPSAVSKSKAKPRARGPAAPKRAKVAPV